MIEKIKNEVQKLMSGDADGHGFAHVKRVYDLAVEIADKEHADMDLTAIAALLHDADDYKLFGEACAANLTNARRIMNDANVSAEMQEKVCAIIQNMGYSKALKGIRPQTQEGQIVSDADMLDAIGAVSIVRTLAYTITTGSGVIFNRDVFPERNLTAGSYSAKGRQTDSFVNHFFDKLLKLKDMMFTESARAEAKVRHAFMVDFLRQFFIENNCPEWVDYLENYEKKQYAAQTME